MMAKWYMCSASFSRRSGSDTTRLRRRTVFTLSISIRNRICRARRSGNIPGGGVLVGSIGECNIKAVVFPAHGTH